ncbi:MAG: oligopeptide/dipeptide ABC transporter ATP-binding protein, partial [Microvirga sp.]
HDVFSRPRHPYTAGLLNCVPSIDLDDGAKRLQPIAGSPPDLADPPPGCRFHPRCPMAEPRCRSGIFPLREVAPDHFSACINHDALPQARAAREALDDPASPGSSRSYAP